MKLVELVYMETAGFPKEEVFGLVSQIRRSAVSIPSNIAEGSARTSSKELLQFLGIANGSLAELETQLEISVRLGYVHGDALIHAQLSRVGRLLVGLRRSVKGKSG